MRFVYISGLILGSILLGTAGYMLIERWTLAESFYMTMITLTTVGYGEVRAMSTAGRMFTIALLLVGVGAVFYGTASIAEGMIEGRIRSLMGRRKRVREIQHLQHHHIICGYGGIGENVSQELARHSLSFVIVEKNPEIVSRLSDEGILAIQGDATNDETLLEAGITKAASLICVLPTDAENVFITLSARSLNPNLNIICQADSESSIPKLEKAGANRVISPHIMGAMRISQCIVRPKLVNFMDEIAGHTTANLDFEEATIPEGSDLVGRELRESKISQDTGVYILAVRRREGRMMFNPGPGLILEEGDHLYALGLPNQVASLRKRVSIA